MRSGCLKCGVLYFEIFSLSSIAKLTTSTVSRTEKEVMVWIKLEKMCKPYEAHFVTYML